MSALTQKRPAGATETTWRAARFFRIEGDAIRCTLCPHACALDDHEIGFCGIRRRQGAIIETATYSATVQHLDRIEKKPLYHFHPGSQVLTVGAPGCSFSCHYCQNFRLSQAGKDRPLPTDLRPVEPADIVEEARTHGASIGFSYSEPSLAAELTMEVAALGRSVGVAVVWKTNGFVTPDALETVAPSLSAVNIDLKAADEQRHRRLTGASLTPVLETFRFLARTSVWLEVSTPVIPGVNADRASLERIAGTIAEAGRDIPWHLGRFNPDFHMGRSRPTQPQELELAAQVGKQAGLHYVYIERAAGATRDTECPRCRTVVVRRDIWRTLSVSLENGACPSCGLLISGEW